MEQDEKTVRGAVLPGVPCRPVARAITSMGRHEMVQCLETIRAQLYPALDPDYQWEADTIDGVARVLHQHDLTPHYDPGDLAAWHLAQTVRAVDWARRHCVATPGYPDNPSTQTRRRAAEHEFLAHWPYEPCPEETGDVCNVSERPPFRVALRAASLSVVYDDALKIPEGWQPDTIPTRPAK